MFESRRRSNKNSNSNNDIIEKNDDNDNTENGNNQKIRKQQYENNTNNDDRDVILKLFVQGALGGTPTGTASPRPNVPLRTASWSVLDGLWGVLKGSFGCAGRRDPPIPLAYVAPINYKRPVFMGVLSDSPMIPSLNHQPTRRFP